ncbi:prenyltransferase [Chloroflexus sp.]|uniref:prenyltransferase n=1 Tax=Chloroflexus sp. TaxID=1904827 RepID=UPI002610EAA0|nr:prenyltransferase [uncultured Chloroflexus sp.]
MHRTLLGLWQMSRPLILPSGALAYFVGTAIAAHNQPPLAWEQQAAGLTLTMLANLAAHYADEYADADTDALACHTGISGGSGAIAAGLASRQLALQAALVVSGLTVVGGLWAVASGLLPPAAGVILLIGLAGGWAYSMPPLALERRGWGEITNALLGGLFMPLMAYASSRGTPPLTVYLQLLPIVAAAMTCIIGVHWPDRVADGLVGKRTLSVILGQRVRWIWWGWIALAYLLPWILPMAIPPTVAWATLLTLPLGIFVAARATRAESAWPGGLLMSGLMLAHIIAYSAGESLLQVVWR